MAEELTLEKFEEAYNIIKKVVLPTKLVESEYYSNLTGNKVFFKPENMQLTGAYKIRGVAEHGDEVCPAKWQPGDATLRPSLDLVGRL